MKRNIKLFIHNEHYESMSIKESFSVWKMIQTGVVFILQILFEVSYFFGYVLLTAVMSPILVIRFIFGLPHQIQRLLAASQMKQFRTTTGVFMMLAASVVLLVESATIVSSGLALKGRVLGTSDTALEYLQGAQQAFKAQDVAGAHTNLSKALEQFQKSEHELQSAGLALQSLLVVAPQRHDADRLLRAAQLLTAAGIDVTAMLGQLEGIKFGPQGLSGAEQPHRTLTLLISTITEATTKLDQATSLLMAVNVSSIPDDKQSLFVDLRDTLVEIQRNTSALKDTFGLMTQLLLRKQTILFVFQNNNELRASGGFIGTVGTVKVGEGQIRSMDIRSVYDYDGQLHDWIKPPQPLVAVNDRLYLRDANWFADFSESAQTLIQLYEREGGETPDIVVGLTPDVIISLLQLTGPITLPTYNVTLNADNFVEATQTTTSVVYDKGLNQPKQLLADFFPIFMERLSTISGNTALKVFEVLQGMITEKHIVLYARDKALQSELERFNWAGRLRSTDRDYLSVSFTNLGGTKTDRFLERSITQKTTITAQGTIRNTVTIVVKNPLPQQDGLHNLSLIRLYVPHNSRLLNSTGFEPLPLPTLDSPRYKNLASITAWEQSLVRDVTTGTYSGTESGKTMFANWLRVEGRQEKTVSLTYELPFTLQDTDRYSLMVQKQPGSNAHQFTHNIELQNYSVLWQTDSMTSFSLNSDRFLGYILTRP